MRANPAERAIRDLANEMKSWKSISLESKAEVTTHVLSKGVSPKSRNVERYIETSSGQRMLDVTMSDLTDSPPAHHASYCDGSRCALVRYRGSKDQGSVEIGRSFEREGYTGGNSRPYPLCYFYVDKAPLYEALPKATYLGVGHHAGRPTEVFLFRRVRWGMADQDFVYDLDRQTSIPIRMRVYPDLRDRSPDATNPGWVWAALTVDEVQGHHLPLRSELTTFVSEKGEATTAKREVRALELRDVRFDARFPKETFWPVIQRGVQVYDSIKKKTYREGMAKDKAEVTTGGDASATASTAATEPSALGGSSPSFASASLGLGGVLLATGVLLMLKRRSSAGPGKSPLDR